MPVASTFNLNGPMAPKLPNYFFPGGSHGPFAADEASQMQWQENALRDANTYAAAHPYTPPSIPGVPMLTKPEGMSDQQFTQNISLLTNAGLPLTQAGMYMPAGATPIPNPRPSSIPPNAPSGYVSVTNGNPQPQARPATTATATSPTTPQPQYGMFGGSFGNLFDPSAMSQYLQSFNPTGSQGQSPYFPT